MNKSKYDRIDIKQYKEGWVKCPSCGFRFYLYDRNEWSGMIHKRCGQRLKVIDFNDEMKFTWCLKANIWEEGTSRFRPGTKVYLFPPLWGDGYENIKVIGKDKETKKFIEIIVSYKKLGNFRVDKTSKPDIMSRLSGYFDDSEESKKLTESLKESFKKNK